MKKRFTITDFDDLSFHDDQFDGFELIHKKWDDNLVFKLDIIHTVFNNKDLTDDNTKMVLADLYFSDVINLKIILDSTNFYGFSHFYILDISRNNESTIHNIHRWDWLIELNDSNKISFSSSGFILKYKSKPIKIESQPLRNNLKRKLSKSNIM